MVFVRNYRLVTEVFESISDLCLSKYVYAEGSFCKLGFYVFGRVFMSTWSLTHPRSSAQRRGSWVPLSGFALRAQPGSTQDPQRFATLKR